MAVRRQRATAESKLLDNATADALTLTDKRFESLECRGEMTIASTGAQNGVRLAGRLTTLVATIASSFSSIIGADLAIVGLSILGLTPGGVLAAGARFADFHVGSAKASIPQSVARIAFRSGRGRLLAAGVLFGRFAGSLRICTAASGTIAAA